MLSRSEPSVGATIGPVNESPTIRIPRWIQLVGLPVLLLLAFLLARTMGHVLFLFLTAAVIALTLNPLVRDVQRLRVPRGLAVLLVYVIFSTAVVGVLVALDHRRRRPDARRRPTGSTST